MITVRTRSLPGVSMVGFSIGDRKALYRHKIFAGVRAVMFSVKGWRLGRLDRNDYGPHKVFSGRVGGEVFC